MSGSKTTRQSTKQGGANSTNNLAPQGDQSKAQDVTDVDTPTSVASSNVSTTSTAAAIIANALNLHLDESNSGVVPIAANPLRPTTVTPQAIVGSAAASVSPQAVVGNAAAPVPPLPIGSTQTEQSTTLPARFVPPFISHEELEHSRAQAAAIRTEAASKSTWTVVPGYKVNALAAGK